MDQQGENKFHQKSLSEPEIRHLPSSKSQTVTDHLGVLKEVYLDKGSLHPENPQQTCKIILELEPDEQTTLKEIESISFFCAKDKTLKLGKYLAYCLGKEPVDQDNEQVLLDQMHNTDDEPLNILVSK